MWVHMRALVVCSLVVCGGVFATSQTAIEDLTQGHVHMTSPFQDHLDVIQKTKAEFILEPTLSNLSGCVTRITDLFEAMKARNISDMSLFEGFNSKAFVTSASQLQELHLSEVSPAQLRDFMLMHYCPMGCGKDQVCDDLTREDMFAQLVTVFENVPTLFAGQCLAQERLYGQLSLSHAGRGAHLAKLKESFVSYDQFQTCFNAVASFYWAVEKAQLDAIIHDRMTKPLEHESRFMPFISVWADPEVQPMMRPREKLMEALHTLMNERFAITLMFSGLTFGGSICADIQND